VSGRGWKLVSAKPAMAVTRPEQKARLSGGSVRVSTRDQTMLTEKQATHTMQLTKPMRSMRWAWLQGATATITPQKPMSSARAFFGVMRSPRNAADSREMTIGEVKTRM